MDGSFHRQQVWNASEPALQLLLLPLHINATPVLSGESFRPPFVQNFNGNGVSQAGDSFQSVNLAGASTAGRGKAWLYVNAEQTSRAGETFRPPLSLHPSDTRTVHAGDPCHSIDKRFALFLPI